MTRYSIRRVNGSNEKLGLAIMQLHLDTFGISADVPSTLEGYWWLVTLDGKPVGFAGLLEQDDDGYLCRAGVLAAHRGNGLQRRLLSARERYARKLDLCRLVTDTVHPHVERNLAACGFRRFKPAEPFGTPESSYWHKKL